ncbi:glucose-6-phosphate 1-dehydrogenase [Catenuloplanes nepalensis]|uniref:Glucose-6-phosphate 1-dehydrogenase n=1 Tax=Catenuloplanes nepalensis TaxID=587533 RepID=A0ABT9MUS9_9ACTN|nr:glucose-6-phosphate dehydrogenase [Catenuloplanes nepalensis]MDP9795200.1 glucose-6-phosphate 1-dehydrogenase [Catenuloplanes nepalensis]
MDGRADAVVLFGVTGDLAAKKLIPALYELTRRGRLDVPVIGVARSAWDHEQLVTAVRKAVTEAVDVVDEAAFDALAARLAMVSGSYDSADTYQRLAALLTGAGRPLFYLAIPPAVFTDVVGGLTASGLAARGRVIVEKPFGHDLASASALAVTLRGAFDPARIFRIDHYLGKEAVEGITAVRFGNRLLEPIWSREHIDNVQITLAEEFGTQGRAGFYDRSGAVRDVLQNHVLQVAALLAMEPGGKSEELHVLRRMRPLTPASTVFGQYAGYADESGVAPGSTTETFVASTLRIDTRRWAGVPFHLRAGKHLGATTTEVVVTLRPASSAPPGFAPNLLRLRLGRGDGLGLTLNVKEPGGTVAAHPVPLDVDFGTVFGRRQEAYERLIDDALDGRPDRFASEETIREEWRIVAPVLDGSVLPRPYERGGWGPETAGTRPAGGWHPLGR